MKSPRRRAIKKMKQETRKTSLPTLQIVKVEELRVSGMNLNKGNKRLEKIANLMVVWSENPSFPVQICLDLYKGETEWTVESIHATGETPIDMTKPTWVKDVHYHEDFIEYAAFVRENKERMLDYLLNHYPETKQALALA